MSSQRHSQLNWQTLPLISLIISEWRFWHAERIKPRFSLAPVPQDTDTLTPYPIDMRPLLALPHGPLDKAGVVLARATAAYPEGYYATAIAQYGLACWNVYLATGDEKYRQHFATQADWLMANEERLSHNAGGWPFTFPLPKYHASVPWLSALTQGHGISMMVRAYQLSKNEAYLQVARRALRTFERDILDGGVTASVGETGIFFEEVAAYPAAHILNGYMYALFGLYEYVALTGDTQVAIRIEQSLTALHSLLDKFDMGYWSRYDLLHRHPATHFYHSLHIAMLKVLARYSGDTRYAALAARWETYQQSFFCHLRYFIASRFFRYRRGFQLLLNRKKAASPESIPASPSANSITRLDTKKRQVLR